MKLRAIRVENVRSFLDRAELTIEGDISIIIGPNGGGKTNLLDTIITFIRRHLLMSWVSRTTQTEERILEQFEGNNEINNIPYGKHSLGSNLPQIIEFDLEVTASDLNNIASLIADENKIASIEGIRISGGTSASIIKSWNPTLLSIGQRLTYRIVNNSLQASNDPAHDLYREYLNNFEQFSQKRAFLGLADLTTPMLALPVTRTQSAFQSSLALSGYNEADYKKGVDNSTSKSSGSSTIMAIGRLAKKWRDLLELADGKTRQVFESDPNVIELTALLKSLGYSWNLKCTNTNNNQYDISLEKQGGSFLANNASSGEKELLTYLFGIYALGVKDALVVIDEPELHLHPRWQQLLLTLFEKLAEKTGNQFVLATHSSTFIAPASIQYVSRVFSEGQCSRITKLNDLAMPNRKHVFQIINSHNNEKIFFADKVILVEGITDRLVFEAIQRETPSLQRNSEIHEIIEVGGKGFFASYRQLLNACQIRHSVIADLDYIEQIGTEGIKKIFELDAKELIADVVKNKKSSDGNALAQSINHAIETGDTDQLKNTWEYIVANRQKIKQPLSSKEQEELDNFVRQKELEGVLLLPKGNIESYLPTGHAKKDVEKIIELLESPDFEKKLPTGAFDALKNILEQAIARDTTRN